MNFYGRRRRQRLHSVDSNESTDPRVAVWGDFVCRMKLRRRAPDWRLNVYDGGVGLSQRGNESRVEVLLANIYEQLRGAST